MSVTRNIVWLGEWTDLTSTFTLEQLGLLMRMVQQHVDGQEPQPTDDKEVAMAYRFIAGGVDRSMEKYAEICQKRADAARKKAEKEKQAKADKSNQMDANAGNNNPNPIPNSNPNSIPNPIPNNNPTPHKGVSEIDARTRMGVEFFGSFHNVELLPQEYRTLVEQYGEALVNETIESLSCKLMDGNAQSIHHYATLQSWLRHSYKTAPTTPATETEEQSIRHTWDTLTPQEQEQHLKEHGGLYPWQDPKYNKSLRTKDNGKTK